MSKIQINLIGLLLTLTVTLQVNAEQNNRFVGNKNILVEGAALHGANGLYFDHDDVLHVASWIGREIVQFDVDSCKIIGRLGSDVGIEGSDDLLFGSDGALYWASTPTGEVGRLTPDGKLRVQFVAPGVNPISFSDDGRLFVAAAFLSDGLYELDPELVDPPKLILPNLGFLNGMDFGPDGLLYAPVVTRGKIVRIDVDARTVENVSMGFREPTSVDFGPNGLLYASDRGTGKLVTVNLATGKKELVTQTHPGVDNMAFDSQGRLFLSNAMNGRVVEVREDGAVRTVTPGGLITPAGLAVVQEGGRDSVYVADFWTLKKFDGKTGARIGIERNDFVRESIVAPTTVAPLGKNLIVTAAFPPVVQIWDPVADKQIQVFPDFAVPLNAIGFGDDFVVAELVTGQVKRGSTRESLITGLSIPTGLAARGGDLWVADWGTGIVWQAVDSNVKLNPPIPVATGLARPEGLAVDQDGTLLVVETGTGRLLRIDPITGTIGTVAVGLDFVQSTISGTPPHGIIAGVAVGSSGDIYVSGDGANVLYRFSPNSEKQIKETQSHRFNYAIKKLNAKNARHKNRCMRFSPPRAI